MYLIKNPIYSPMVIKGGGKKSGKMMYRVYIDVIFAVNFLMDLAVLAMLNQLFSYRADFKHMLKGAFVGALWACILAAFPGIPLILQMFMYLRRNNKTKLEVSIDEPLNVDWDGNELLLSDILGTDEDVIYHGIEDEIEKNLLNTAISRLAPRERKIVELRYGLTSADGEEMTQKEVADLMGISQSYISRLEKKIMKRLKKEIVRFE